MKKEKLVEVIDYTRKILQEHHLCDHCIGRMFAKRLGVLSYNKLGKKIRYILKQKNPKSCYICKNLMFDMDTHLRKMLEISKEYEFSSFLVGAILKPSILDRDDIIRSKFKLRGIVGIKSEVTREIGKRFGRKTRTKVDYNNPDVVLTIDFKKELYEIKPKAVLLKGRYTKNARGIPQKQKPCVQCEGKGCFHCDFHGISDFNSVEGKIAKFLFEKFGAQQAKITWVGSEDESSLVLGKGRPFFVKLINPLKRNASLSHKITLDGISILNLGIISKIPSDHLKFRAQVVLEVEAENKVKPHVLKTLYYLKEQPISLRENRSWKNKKRIYSIKLKQKSYKSFTMLIELDGGIPIKRLVSGQDVEPSLSSILENQCKCKFFDFHKIALTN
jgi:tRNA pseudouridine synthase 10